ncbi:MAG TPA: hypothetical protein VGE46_06345 [Bdellovibrio sp.]
MSFLRLIPLSDVPGSELFQHSRSLQEFLSAIVAAIPMCTDVREQQAYLSVYMAFRDHYPSYLKSIDPKTLHDLDQRIAAADPKIIKLRRIVLSELAKVA